MGQFIAAETADGRQFQIYVNEGWNGDRIKITILREAQKDWAQPVNQKRAAQMFAWLAKEKGVRPQMAANVVRSLLTQVRATNPSLVDDDPANYTFSMGGTTSY